MKRKLRFPKGSTEIFNECRHDEPITDIKFKKILKEVRKQKG